ncbi:hypothetical protein F4803DRAFT_509996 [Xylaria telfairii]|nr:hypothetical protein F4803DRAFT_509996 [Xylaria telfairii]
MPNASTNMCAMWRFRFLLCISGRNVTVPPFWIATECAKGPSNPPGSRALIWPYCRCLISAWFQLFVSRRTCYNRREPPELII